MICSGDATRAEPDEVPTLFIEHHDVVSRKGILDPAHVLIRHVVVENEIWQAFSDADRRIVRLGSIGGSDDFHPGNYRRCQVDATSLVLG